METVVLYVKMHHNCSHHFKVVTIRCFFFNSSLFKSTQIETLLLNFKNWELDKIAPSVCWVSLFFFLVYCEFKGSERDKQIVSIWNGCTRKNTINGFMLFFSTKVWKTHVTPCHEITFRLDAHNVVVLCGHLALTCYNWSEDHDVSSCKYGVHILNVHVTIDGMGKWGKKHGKEIRKFQIF